MAKKNYAVIGEKLTHSISPELHKVILEVLKIDENYTKYNIEKEDLSRKIEDFKNQDIKGLNVTIPYKVLVMKYLDEISEEARKIGAINTIYFTNNNILIGYNSDYYGFGALMKRNKFSILNKSVVILGTGGSSKAVYHYLKDNGAKEIIFISRSKNENTITYDELKLLDDKDIVINTTPIGMYPSVDNSPIREDVMKKFKIAVDIIYNPMETKFLSYAKSCNIKYANGLFMLVYQGIKSQEIWNDVKLKQSEVEFIYEKVKKKFLESKK